MSKIKNPQEKKRLHYDEDHVVCGGEAPHAFRRKWPRKKALSNRLYRRRADQATKAAEKEVRGDAAEHLESTAVTNAMIRKSLRRKPLVKWGVLTVRQEVNNSLEWQKELQQRLRKP
jgi:hypothetical protein